jgi:DNA-binding transcriptional ArsR family regulator
VVTPAVHWKEKVLTVPVDITDPVIAKAFAHPLRIEILGLLEDRVASPVQLAAELGSGLSQTSYHVRQLKRLGLIKLVRRRMQRGAVEHYYTATVRPTIPDTAWARTPRLVRRALVGGKIAQTGSEVAAAAERGGFERDGVYITRTRLRLTAEGWKTVNREFARALQRLDAINAAESDKLAQNPGVETIEATTVMMFFESPPPESFESPGGAGAGAEHDSLEDLAPGR